MDTRSHSSLDSSFELSQFIQDIEEIAKTNQSFFKPKEQIFLAELLDAVKQYTQTNIKKLKKALHEMLRELNAYGYIANASSLKLSSYNKLASFFTQAKNSLPSLISATHSPEPIDVTKPIELVYRRIASFIDSKKVNSLLMPNVKPVDAYGNLFTNLLPGQFIINDAGTSFIELGSFFNAVYRRINNNEKKILQYIDANHQVQLLSSREQARIEALLPITKVFFDLFSESKCTDLECLLNEIILSIEFPLFRLLKLNQLTAIKCLCRENAQLLMMKNQNQETLLELVMDGDFLQALPIDLLQQINRDVIFKFIQLDHLQIVKLLIETNPDFIKHADTSGKTPLEYAILHNKIGIVRYLVAQQADLSKALACAIEINNPSIVRILLKAKVVISLQNILQATQRGCFSIVKLFVKHNKACINFLDQEGNTPLALALQSSPPLFQIAEFLIANGATIKGVADENCSPKTRCSHLLTWAMRNNATSACEILAEYDMNITFEHLSYAITLGQLNLFTRLLNKNPMLINKFSKTGESLLGLACQLNNEPIARFLMLQGAQTSLVNLKGRLPIDWALTQKNNALISLLLISGSPLPTQPILYGELSNFNQMLLTFIRTIGKNNLAEFFQANDNDENKVVSLLTEIINLKSMIENQFAHRPDTSNKKILLNKELSELASCLTFDKLTEKINNINTIISKHSQSGVSKLVKFHWLRKPEGYKKFADQYGKNTEKMLNFKKA